MEIPSGFSAAIPSEQWVCGASDVFGDAHGNACARSNACGSLPDQMFCFESVLNGGVSFGCRVSAWNRLSVRDSRASVVACLRVRR